jgi:hypothetical protein
MIELSERHVLISTTEAVQVLRHHSAEAHIRTMPSGVVDVIYFGVVGRLALESLHTQVMAATRGAGCLVVQFDKAVMMGVSAPLATHNYAGNDAPACWIVSDGQRDMWLDHARTMAGHGLMRVVFARSQLAYAFEMAANLASLRQ